MVFKGEEILASSFILVKLAVTPAHSGKIVTADFTLNVPPTSETFHEWLEFKTTSGENYAVDCMLAQLNEWPCGAGNPILIMPAKDHLSLFSSSRELTQSEVEQSKDTFHKHQKHVEACLKLLHSVDFTAA